MVGGVRIGASQMSLPNFLTLWRITVSLDPFLGDMLDTVAPCGMKPDSFTKHIDFGRLSLELLDQTSQAWSPGVFI